LAPHPVVGLVAHGRRHRAHPELGEQQNRDGGLREANRPRYDRTGAHGLGAGGDLCLFMALVSADTRSMKARKSAETTKAMWMRVYHMSLSLLYCSTLRKICSRWIEEIATMVEATLILSELISI